MGNANEYMRNLQEMYRKSIKSACMLLKFVKYIGNVQEMYKNTWGMYRKCIIDWCLVLRAFKIWEIYTKCIGNV